MTDRQTDGQTELDFIQNYKDISLSETVTIGFLTTYNTNIVISVDTSVKTIHKSIQPFINTNIKTHFNINTIEILPIIQYLLLMFIEYLLTSQTASSLRSLSLMSLSLLRKSHIL